jgi:hypothetical protein
VVLFVFSECVIVLMLVAVEAVARALKNYINDHFRMKMKDWSMSVEAPYRDLLVCPQKNKNNKERKKEKKGKQISEQVHYTLICIQMHMICDAWKAYIFSDIFVFSSIRFSC